MGKKKNPTLNTIDCLRPTREIPKMAGYALDDQASRISGQECVLDLCVCACVLVCVLRWRAPLNKSGKGDRTRKKTIGNDVVQRAAVFLFVSSVCFFRLLSLANHRSVLVDVDDIAFDWGRRDFAAVARRNETGTTKERDRGPCFGTLIDCLWLANDPAVANQRPSKPSHGSYPIFSTKGNPPGADLARLDFGRLWLASDPATANGKPRKPNQA